jgi:hypothetical protein
VIGRVVHLSGDQSKQEVMLALEDFTLSEAKV